MRSTYSLIAVQLMAVAGLLATGTASGQEAISVDAAGNVGIGTSAPQRRLHLKDTNENQHAQFLIEDTGTGSDDKPGFALRSPNAASSGDWAFEVDGGGNFQIDFRPSPNPEILITDTTATNSTVKIFGNLEVLGTCTGCDRVFGADYPLESIDEHAARMWRLGHLPGVGPTPEGATAIDVFQKITGILQELEKAHIYIAQLQEQLRLQGAEIATLKGSGGR